MTDKAREEVCFVAGVSSGQPNLIRAQSVSPISSVCTVRSVDAIRAIGTILASWPLLSFGTRQAFKKVFFCAFIAVC